MRQGRSMLSMVRTVCLLSLVALSLAFAGCGERERALPPLGMEPALSGAPPIPELERGLALGPSNLADGEGVLREEADGPHLILAGGAGRLALDWPEGAAHQPQRLRITVSASAGMTIRAGLVADGRPVDIAGPVRAGSSRRQDLTLLLPPAAACDELWIAWANAPVGARLHGARVRSVPPAERVPEGHGWFRSGSEEREALGLTAWSDVLILDEVQGTSPVRIALARPVGSNAAVAEVWRDNTLVQTLNPGAGPGWTSYVIEGGAPLRLRLAGDPVGALVVAKPQRIRAVGNPRRVLLVTSDTHRGDHVGCTPDGANVQTPVLDALAARGIAFQDAWVATHITNPSHVTLLTATHPRDTGIVDNLTPLSAEAPTLAEAFRDGGFRTMAVVSASHLLPGRSGLGQGFERFAGPATGQANSYDAVGQAIAWLDDVPDEDVFLWVHVFDAHAPYTPAPEAVGPHWPAERDPRDPELPRPASVPPWARDVRDLGYLAALYRAEVDELDERLAPLLTHEFWKQGWIAFTADHGETLGVTDGEFDHRRLDPDNLRVPLILAGPRVPRGSKVETGVATLHLGRTLLDLAGLDEQIFPGQSLLARERLGEARYALARHGGAAALIQGNWLLVLQLVDPLKTPGARALRKHQMMMFDLENDPSCSSDQVERERDRATAMRRRLVAWLGDARHLGWGEATGPVDPQEAAELQALGYATSGGGFTGLEHDCDCEDCRYWLE